MWADDRERFLSLPVTLNMAGWTSDTYRLQQAGWSLSADQDMRTMTMQMAMRHEQMGLYGVSARLAWEYLRDDPQFLRNVELPVRWVGRDIIVQMMGTPDFNFQPIDAIPQLRSQRKRLEDFVHFAPALARTNQIIVPEESVEELMDRILKLQQPDRVERFKRLAKEAQEEGRRIDLQPTKAKFQAQIISLAA
jgi:hypothetical protein